MIDRGTQLGKMNTTLAKKLTNFEKQYIVAGMISQELEMMKMQKESLSNALDTKEIDAYVFNMQMNLLKLKEKSLIFTEFECKAILVGLEQDDKVIKNLSMYNA